MLDENKRADLVREFANILNGLSVDNDLETPDHILADYLVDALDSYGKAMFSRAEWFGKNPDDIESSLRKTISGFGVRNPDGSSSIPFPEDRHMMEE